MKNLNKIILLPLFVFSTGCSTIFSGTSQNLNVKVVDSQNNMLDGTNCIVVDGSGGMNTLLTNPGTVRVSRSNGSVQVNCKKEGYRQLNTSVGDSFNKTALVNILFWPGFFVDAMTGAYKKFPTHYVVSMEKVSDYNKK